MKSALIYALIAILIAPLWGCSSAIVGNLREESSQVGVAAKNARDSMNGNLKLNSGNNNVEVIDGQWVPARKIKKNSNFAQLDRQIVINKPIKSFHELTNYLTSLTQIPFYVDTFVPAGLQTTSPQGMNNASNQSAQAQTVDYDKLNPKTIVYSGSIEGLLNTYVPSFGYYWEYNDQSNSIRLFKYQTQTYRIAALPGDIEFKNNIDNTTSTSATGSGAASAGSVSGSSYQKLGVSSVTSIWKSIEDTVKSMLSASGKAIVSAATGTITVTDTPSNLKEIARYIDTQNESLSKQVILNVRILSVTLNAGDSYGVNWNAVMKSISSIGGAYSTAFTPVASGGNLSITLPTSAGNGGGTSEILTALSTQGDVSEITSTSVQALNNQPSPTQVGSQIAYLQSSTTTLTANVGSTTTLVPGIINVGFAVNMIPHVLDNDDLFCNTQ